MAALSSSLKINAKWYLSMAWLDSKKNWRKLLLYLSSIVMGIAAIVAINTFISNVNSDIEKEAKSLLGADLLLRNTQLPSDSLKQYFELIPQTQAEEIKFSGMIQFVKSGQSRFVSVTANDGVYPFYGAIETEPKEANKTFLSNKEVLLDASLFIQYDLQVGDSLQLGNRRFAIAGKILKMPGQTGFTSAVAPVVVLPYSEIKTTGLITYGSRLAYYRYFKIDNPKTLDETEKELKEKLAKTSFRVESFNKRNERVGEAFGDVGSFLNLVAFIALLLGSIGIAGAVSVYLKGKMRDIAVLSCMGLDARKGFNIYFIQIMGFSLAGSLLGVLLGVFLSYFMPIVLSDFLPVEVSFQPVFSAMLLGLVLGICLSALFSLPSFYKLRATPPLLAINQNINEISLSIPQRIISTFAIAAFLGLFTYLQINSLFNTLIFLASCALALGLLSLVGYSLRGMGKFFIQYFNSFEAKQAWLNLYRPGNQTLLLITTIGLGTALLATLLFTQDMLLGKVTFSGNENDPNLVVFDIQTTQIEEVVSETEKQKLPILAQVPIVTMRLEQLRGQTKEFYNTLKDSLPNDEQIRDNVFNREWRVSYRETLNPNEHIISGEWIGKYQGEEPIPVSIETRYMTSLQAKLGDTLIFNVQGRPLSTYLASERSIDFNRIETNFLLLFPDGVLNNAPKTFVVLSRAADKEASANYQKIMLQAFPTLSIIDLNFIIETLTEVIDKLKFVISFMSLFSIITGFMVLLSSLNSSKNLRLKEFVLLKTLGAKASIITKIALYEYLILGILASLAGILLALGSTYGLSLYTFKTLFVPNPISLLAVFLSVSFAVAIIGFLGTYNLLKTSPLQALRDDTN